MPLERLLCGSKGFREGGIDLPARDTFGRKLWILLGKVVVPLR